ncbi:MAG TPA: sigma-70 family RNA polymerase sigma factor [Lacipirellulaceae bacterium]|nr:sigma-70 family RNA polymerase sigma factor [Lacipirellulaceae bacterium]
MPDDTRDPLVFSELLRDARGRVFGYLLALVQNLADAEDLYQQTALLLWEKYDQYTPGTDFGSWATTVAHFTALNFLRRQSRRRALFSEAAMERLATIQGELKSSDSTERSEALVHCLGSLPSNERQLVQLRYQGDRTIQDIAQDQQRTVGAVYTALSRIRKTLLACVERRVSKEAA